MTKAEKLSEGNLSQFTGTENWYRHGINRNVLFTDGAKYVADKGGTYWLLELNPAPNSHRLQLSSGSCQTMLSRIRWPSRSTHCSVIQQADTSMTAKRHPPTEVTITSRIDVRGKVTFAPQDGQTSFILDP